jgi:two-component system, OmpR family, KDP operon response regulator KdpE
MRIIICDDDPNQRDHIRICMEVSATRHEFAEFDLGGDALDHLKSNDADLMFLDMGLPDIDGIEVLRQLRKLTDIPVIIVSGNAVTESVAKALLVGADDYITKPFEAIELIARVEAVTRRAAGRKVERTTFTSQGMLLDFDRKQATVDDAKIDLNLTEWDVLKTLLLDPGVVVGYPKLKTEAWGSSNVSDAAVHMAIRRLRQKLQQDSENAGNEGLIRSHRGIGYSISAS